MKYFTYVLLSLSNRYLYIGSTEDVQKRVELHNKGRVRSTKAYKPWKLLECHRFESRSEAFKHEKFLKTHQQKDLIRKKYGLKDGPVAERLGKGLQNPVQRFKSAPDLKK